MTPVERELRRLERREFIHTLIDNLTWPVLSVTALAVSWYKFGIEMTAAFCGAIAPVALIVTLILAKLERRSKSDITTDKS